MMPNVGAILDEIESTLHSGSPKQRHNALMKVTDLFMVGSGRYSPEQVAVFDEVFLRLSEEIEEKARARLAERLAVSAHAPRRIIVKLAYDNAAAVAAPVLQHSPQLSEGDLVTTARTKSQDHLYAISQRVTLSEAVTDVLVDRGERRVVMAVAQNQGARFSENGYGKLVSRAEGDDVLARHVGGRTDIPRHHFLKLMESASAAVRAHLQSAHPHLAEEITATVADVATDINREVRDSSKEYARAKFNTVRRFQSSQLGEAHVHAPAHSDDFEKTVVALALYGRFPVELVERALIDDDPDMILILAKAAGCTHTTVKAFLRMDVAGRKLSSREIDAALARFDRLNPKTAQRIVKFYDKRRQEARTRSQPEPTASRRVPAMRSSA